MSVAESMREKLLDAATILFTNKGFNGTSVREIASKAGGNVSLISYYFGGKQGLLEALMIDYLEGYLDVLEAEVKEKNDSAFEKIMNMAEKSLHYMKDNHLRARFVLREMTLDSMLIREITSTYLMKEKHLYSIILKKGMQEGVFHKLPLSWTIMQFRGMVMMPFLHHQYVREVFQLHPQESHFISVYKKELRTWASKTLLRQKEELEKAFPLIAEIREYGAVKP
ncbi:forespore capture DNA-binding protein RefZ [Alteribacillus iranensis]|uniref:Regulatory protein, tetR family n=1 Tax=Alteribacillus iranensis TaxID=930128 RepID=A0A1I2CHG5_9BACI|nr:forespore capture DNA-binding protein RefZ [Alteribacillus iranensis]SFE67704.1 regulatory protein, tetR family [Alteribacillus iranensis]